MPHGLDQILPSLQSLGVLGYWLIGLAAALESFFLTGVVVPGTLIVDAGGILVQRGLLDFFDLVWFVALGSALGSEFSYWVGRLAMHRLPGRRRIGESAAFSRAKALFEKRGGVALVVGRFLGPLAGLVPLAAGMAGMNRRQFVIWNLFGSIPYAFAHVAIGYFLGDVVGRIGGSFTRVAVLTGIVALLLIILWSLLYSALRLLPLALAVLSAALRNLADLPAVSRRIEAHPETAQWVRARFDRSAFSGLPLTLLGGIFLYIAAVWLQSVAEFLSGDPMLQLDMRLAELIHHFQSPGPIRIASLITAAGGWRVVMPLVAAATLWLLLRGRRPLAVGLLVSVIGNAVSVALLKLAFGRPRSPLGVFAETSASFPSGHAAASVAAYGMLMYVLWRAGKLRAETALLIAGLVAFAIGVSRIYLIEHYLSDVLNGWLVGAMWLTVGVAIAEWRTARTAAPALPAHGKVRIAGLAVIAALVGLAALNVWRYDHPRNTPLRTADRVLSDASALAAVDGLPAMTESLMGSSVHPVSVIVFARDETALSEAMLASGWSASRLPSPGLLFDALYAAIEGDEDPTIETVAHFWRGQPNDLAFAYHPQGGGAGSPADPRARFWRSEFVTPDGLRAFFGTVGIDEAADLAGREDLARALRAHGATDPMHIAVPLAGADTQPAEPVDVLVLTLR